MKFVCLFLVLSFFVLQNAFSQEVQKETNRSGSKQFAVALKYHTGNEIHGAYTDTSGNYFVATIPQSFSILGVGGSYLMPFSDYMNFRAGLFFSGLSEKLFNFENGLIVQVVGHLGFRFDQHGFYFGPNVQQMVAVKPLTYTPHVGGGAGYQYFFNDEFSVDFGFELITFKSKNPEGFIADQKTEMRTYNFTLSYYLF